jgi:hypothetical protein
MEEYFQNTSNPKGKRREIEPSGSGASRDSSAHSSNKNTKRNEMIGIQSGHKHIHA